MNLVVGAPFWLLGLLLLILLAAVVEDVIRLRISNPTCVAVFVLAIIAMAVHGFQLALWQNAVVFVVILALGSFTFGAGWLGGGDVKLLAALGLWVDLRGAMLLMAATFIIGGVIGLIYLVARAVRSRRNDPAARERRIPYGLAIAAGALVTFGLQFSKPAPNPYNAQLKAAERR